MKGAEKDGFTKMLRTRIEVTTRFLNTAAAPDLARIVRQGVDRVGRSRGLSHGIFRFPAKMHAPLVRALVSNYTRPGEAIFDPFVGSGTTLVESTALGRLGYGVDVDPLAVFLSRVKTRRYNEGVLDRYLSRLKVEVVRAKRTSERLDRLSTADLSESYVNRELRNLGFPRIENRDHWFNRYVALDFARLVRSIDELVPKGKYRDLFSICALATVRRISRADPIPSSGLEVTSRMLALEREGRRIDVGAEFLRHVARQLSGVIEYSRTISEECAYIAQLDMRTASRDSLIEFVPRGRVSAIITSPPYLRAIEYHRRFQLERAFLDSRYPGRIEHRMIGRKWKNDVASPVELRNWDWFRVVESTSISAARSCLAYFSELSRSIVTAGSLLDYGSSLLLFIGNSSVAGTIVPTADTLLQLLGEEFFLVDRIAYPVHNRYMSYQRHNGTGTMEEHLLVLRRRNIN